MTVSRRPCSFSERVTGCRSGKSTRALWLAGLSVAVFPWLRTTLVRADTELDVPNGTTDLTTLGSTSSSDLTFDNITYSSTAFTANTSITVATLNDLDNTQALNISNTNATADMITVNGGSDVVSGSNASDLIFAPTGANLTINGGVAGSGTITNTIAFSAAGNLDVAGQATITSPLTSSNLLTLIGGGIVNLGPSSAAATGNNGLTGGVDIQNGTLSLGGATNEPEWDLGPQSTAQVTIGGGSPGTNATLNIGVATANILYNITIAATGTSTISNSSTGTVTFLTGTFVLDNNLNVAETSTGTLGFRNTITAPGTQGITVTTANTGTVNFQGASTYTGGVTIDGGVVSFSTTEGSANPASGPFGGGTVTLGGAASSSATLSDTGNFNLGNPLIIGPANSGITRTITATATTGNPIIDSGESMILESNLLVQETNATESFGFRNTISESGGSYSITIDPNNVGTINFQIGTNTFSGGVAIDSGTVSFGVSSQNPVSGGGPFGSGTVNLGAGAVATTLNDTGALSLFNPITVSNSLSTIGETSTSSTAGVISGPITLGANNLTLTAAATSLATGADRLRVGSGGITGSGNIIVDNLNNLSTSPTAKGPIRIDGTGAVTSTWTGNLIVEAGLASLSTGATIDGTSASNAVMVASGGAFDFASNTGANSGFSPTIAGLDDYTGPGALSGTGAVVFQSAPSNNTLNLAGSGIYTYSGSIQDSTNTGNTTALAVSLGTGGTQTLMGSNTYSGGTTVNSGKLVVGVNGALPANGALSIGATGTVQLATQTGGETLSSLAVTTGGTLDVTNNHVIINYSATDPITSILGYLSSGSNGGLWTGTGITSSTAAGNSNYGVGYADGAAGVDSNLTSGEIELAYVQYGDITLSGLVNAQDFSILSNNFGHVVTGGWQDGDFTYSGTVNAEDFHLLAENFGQTETGEDIATSSEWAAINAFAAANGLSVASVPEPASVGLLALSGAGLLCRRRRKTIR